jgi:hypothetical protein
MRLFLGSLHYDIWIRIFRFNLFHVKNPPEGGLCNEAEYQLCTLVEPPYFYYILVKMIHPGVLSLPLLSLALALYPMMPRKSQLPSFSQQNKELRNFRLFHHLFII